MQSVNVLEAKSSLSRLLDAIEQGREQEIIIVRNGRPVARLVPIADTTAASDRRFGVAKGLFVVPDDFDTMHADEIRRLFEGDE